ncbi:uncharacterized protein [Garra rufa]|uniref:uncharacterized protein isoform X1 n=1 Tax=Garra rufa TaxID=137080 RepID=UPI003CCE7403
MAYDVRYSFLLIIICFRITSWTHSLLQVTTLIRADGNEVIVQCATDKTSQDGVYMYKQGASEKMQTVFYYYKDNTFTPKSPMCKDKVKVNGTFPTLNVSFLNVNVTDIGLYWCEFNLEDKITIGTVTLLWIIEEKTNKTGEEECKSFKNNTAEGKNEGKVCTYNDSYKTILVLCVVMLLLCISAFIFLIWKVRGSWRNKKYKPSNKTSDSVYEEMKRSNLDAPPSVCTFINPDYQSARLLR